MPQNDGASLARNEFIEDTIATSEASGLIRRGTVLTKKVRKLLQDFGHDFSAPVLEASKSRQEQ